MKFPKIKAEHIFLIIMLTILIWTGFANLWSNQLTHEHPYSYLAGDAFQHWVRTDGIKQTGNYRYRVDFQTYGYDDVIGDYPPILFHLAIIFSDLSNLPTFDAIYFLIFLSAILASFIMYLIVKDMNRHVAIISFPFMVLLFSGASYSAYTWGHWPSVMSQLFLVGIVWSIKNIDLKKSYLLIAAFFTASILTHTSEAIIGFFFVLFYLAVQLILKKDFKKKFKTLFIAGIISFITSLYYLFIFKNTWAFWQKYQFNIIKETGGSPTVQFWIYGIFSIIILVGFLISVVLLAQKKSNTTILSTIFFLVIGYTNYIGFHSRAFQIRFWWPIYLAPAIGITIYYGLKIIIKKWNSSYSYGLAFVLLLLFLNVGGVATAIPQIPSYQEFSTPGTMDPYRWQAYQWIHENTAQDAKMLFLYGDIYGQTNYLLSIKRVPYKIDFDDLFTSLQKNQSERYFIINIYGDNVNSYPYWKSPFKFGYHLRDTDEFEHGLKKDICDFDYYIYDKVSRDERLPQFNLLLASNFKNKGLEEVFSNQIVSII
ncbi:MAG: hypothetical protein QF915_00640, partial [Candidatus Woesearchaeota archaeon]|nr:hypothetical protein [Candidatus Woesearchaeota archaeon]